MPITQVVLLCLTFALCITMTMSAQSTAADDAGADWSQYPAGVRVILENTKPLTQPLADRFPLLLLPAHDCVVQDERLQERIVVDLHKRGVAALATWQPGKNERDKALADGLRLARIQQKLGLKVCVNANACMYSFNNGDPSTAYVDADGKPFFDKSIPNKIGSPFRLDHRYAAMREQVEFFARGYREAGVPLDFVYGDWEIDGPLEVNHAWDAAKRCTVTREHIPDIDTKFKVGDIVKGTVAKIASFGAFVSLDGDIDGLIHISQLSEEHVERVKDILKVADEVEARVIKVDKIERRIGLSIKAVEYSEEQLQKESQSFETLRPSSDLVGLEQAFNLAAAATGPEEEEWSPSAEPETPSEKEEKSE
ncbi:MAG: S1 RNA-binding domain-containing protein [Phycisphaeraceae bacterium]|nr:S1 RNA-binding domain-containing protein [Phycisphaeraceae bacterium]